VPPTDFDKDLNRLETELKRLEAEYNMFFAGRLPRPPWETRARVTALVKQYDRMPIQNTGHRFRFSTLQSRYAALTELWDRGLRAREEGRGGGSFGKQRPVIAAPDRERPENRVLHVAAFRDPMREMDKLHELYDSLTEARRELGQDSVPFERFSEIVRQQVHKMAAADASEVAFRVAVKDGKVNLTAKKLRGAPNAGGSEE
jgi:hypothetical protein